MIYERTEKKCSCGHWMYFIPLRDGAYDILCLFCDLHLADRDGSLPRYLYDDQPCTGCPEIEYNDEGGWCTRPETPVVH